MLELRWQGKSLDDCIVLSGYGALADANRLRPQVGRVLKAALHDAPEEVKARCRKSPHRLSEEDQMRFRKLYESRVPLKVIESTLNLGKGASAYWREKLQIEKRASPVDYDAIDVLLKEGLPGKAIARRLGHDPDTVYRRKRKLKEEGLLD